jgi:hypothetical protein
MMRGSCLEISPPQAIRTDSGMWRVTATVGGQEVFFESDAPLVAAAEAFLGAFLFPAMSQGMSLRVAAPVCPEWLSHMDAVRPTVGRWWSYTGGEIFHEGEASHAQRPEWGLFFGGGVDSFSTLQREHERLRHLIYVQGYDVSIRDPERLDRILEWNRAVAEETGKELITVRTNLRRHKIFRSITWEHTYGAALVAVAHMLREVCGTLLISAGFYLPETFPHGSHHELDPLWSSKATRIVYYGYDRRRREKTAAIASYPPAQKYLRVCWEHRKPELNCGECEKCLRTQLELFTSGNLDKMKTFPDGSLRARIDGLSHVAKHLIFFYEEMLDDIDDPDVRQSVEALLVRSREWQPPQPWYRRLFRSRRK